MSNLVRFGVSLDKELLRKFDELIKEKKYTNRSEAIRPDQGRLGQKRMAGRQRSHRVNDPCL